MINLKDIKLPDFYETLLEARVTQEVDVRMSRILLQIYEHNFYGKIYLLNMTGSAYRLKIG